MDAGIFITDNRLKFSQELADFLRDKGIKVCLTAEPLDNSKELPVTTGITWNRNSIFSLQSIPLQLKNMEIILDTSIIVFDAPSYMSIYPDTDILTVEAVCQELIAANASLTFVLRNYFLKTGSGKLIFIHKDFSTPCGNVAIAAASNAFIKIAEETVSFLQKQNITTIQTLLVKLENAQTKEAVEWLFNQLNLPVLTRNSGRWIKACQRSFFGI